MRLSVAAPDDGLPEAKSFDTGTRPYQAGGMRTPRQAARTVVLDPDGAVFLVRSVNSEVGVHWAPPGGGLEDGESPRAAARRELGEETGRTDLAPGPLLCTWEHDFTGRGVPVRQFEHIYLSRGPHRGPVGDVSGTHAAEGIDDWRWWTPEQLGESGAEPLWPPVLPQLLADLLEAWARGRSEFPSVELGYLPTE